MTGKKTKIEGRIPYAPVKVKPCHGSVEIYPGLWVGGLCDSYDMYPFVDVLVPLDTLGGDVWDHHWRGEIYYVPIKDFSVLPRDVAQNRAQAVVDFIKSGKSVGIFCIGGHGRTGYFASLVLGLLGVADPIKLLRENYCSEVLETKEQISEVAAILGRPELAELHKPRASSMFLWPYQDYAGYGYGSIWDPYDYVPSGKEQVPEREGRCEDCEFYQPYSKYAGSGDCLCRNWGTVFEDDEPCSDFVARQRR